MTLQPLKSRKDEIRRVWKKEKSMEEKMRREDRKGLEIKEEKKREEERREDEERRKKKRKEDVSKEERRGYLIQANRI